MRRVSIAAVILIAAIWSLAACGSATDSSDAGATPSSQIQAAASSDIGSPVPSSDLGTDTASAAATPPCTDYSCGCTSHTCIARQLEQSLTGLVALDYSVATNVKCYASSVQYHQAADSYSASCTVTYSNGNQADGTGNLIGSTGAATFTPSGT
jgi:hypothetical protein